MTIELTAEEQQAIAPLVDAVDSMALMAFQVGAKQRTEEALIERRTATVHLQAALLVARARADEWGNDRLDDLHSLEARIRTLEAALGEAR